MKSEKTKKNTKEVEVSDKKKKTHPLLQSPRVTEKSAILAEKGVYTFNVPQNANKNEIKKAVKFVYGVAPVSVSITQIANKTVTRRGVVSIKRNEKKAVVHLKKGDKITFA
jgi:large subunit ribosomal protein L23